MTRYDPDRHHRRSIRLKGYDYTQPGAYFITLCTHERAHLFGRVVEGVMVVNALGEIARQCWLVIPDHFPHTRLDEFVIMPNHVHGIIWIEIAPVAVGVRHAMPQRFGQPVPGSIPTIVRSFKSAVTARINQYRGTPGAPVWQRNYYEHIIRTNRALHAIRQYIHDNPLRWHLDRYNPDTAGPNPPTRKIRHMMKNQEDAL